MKWESPRGPISIDPETRDIVQTIYIRKVEKVGGKLVNVESTRSRTSRTRCIEPAMNEVAGCRLEPVAPSGRPLTDALIPLWQSGSDAILAGAGPLLGDERSRSGKPTGPMLPPVFGVLFDGFAYGMLLFLLSVGLSVTLGLMNFVNLAHGAFAMLGGYVTVTADERFRLAVLRHPAGRLHRRRGHQRRVRAHAVPPALPRHRSRPGAADHRPRLHLGRGRRPISSAPCSSRSQLPTICAARSTCCGSTSRIYRMFLIARRAADHRAAGRRARIHPLRRAGARRGRQPAHGARARHRRRPHLRHHLRARHRASPASAARWRSRSSASIRISPSPISSMC